MRRVLLLGPPGSGKIAKARAIHAEVNPRPLEGDTAMLVATASLCACGLLGTQGLRPCSCSPRALESHAERLESFRRALHLDEVIALEPKTVAESLEVNRG